MCATSHCFNQYTVIKDSVRFSNAYIHREERSYLLHEMLCRKDLLTQSLVPILAEIVHSTLATP